MIPASIRAAVLRLPGVSYRTFLGLIPTRVAKPLMLGSSRNKDTATIFRRLLLCHRDQNSSSRRFSAIVSLHTQTSITEYSFLIGVRQRLGDRKAFQAILS